jgi:hypothetical protein
LAEIRNGSGAKSYRVVVAQVLKAVMHTDLQAGGCSTVEVGPVSSEGEALDGFRTVQRLEPENNDLRY